MSVVFNFFFCVLCLPFAGSLFYIYVKVARRNSFVATPSILESLTLKQIDLYGKTIITHVLHTD